MKWTLLNNSNEASFASVRKTIIFCLLLSFLFAILIISLLTVVFNQTQEEAEILTTMGRQQLLPQKIVKDIYRIQGTDLSEKEILADLKVFESTYKTLRKATNQTGFISKTIVHDTDNIFEEIDSYSALLVNLGTLSNLNTLTEKQLLHLEHAEKGFLVHMDDLVNLYQRRHEQTLNRLNYLVALSIGLFFLFLIVLYKTLFKPIIGAVRSSLAERHDQVLLRESILENTSDLIWAVDKNYNLIACNSAFQNSMEKEMERTMVVGENILDFDYKHINARQRKELYDRALNGERFEVELEYLKNGQKVNQELSFHPIYDEHNAIAACSVFGKDITKKVRTYKQLRRSETYLKEAQEIANIGNWNWDMFKNEISWSDQLYKVFDRSPETFEATYEGLMKVICPEDQANFGTHIENCLTKDEPLDIVHRIVLPDNSIRYVHQKGKAHFAEDGTPMRMAGTIQEVTDLEKARLQNLKQFNELQNFVYIISHNVRAPISTLQSLVDIIEPGNDELNAEIIPTIGTTVDTLDQTIRDLNDALSLKNVDEKMFQYVNLNTILKNIEHLISMDINSSKAKIEYDISKAPTAYGIPSYYTNILFNLILNAIKYRAEERPPHIKVRSRPISDGLEIYVEDNGIGMELTKEKRKRIFDMYGRLSGTSEGRGMGLYLAKTQIEAMRGCIDVKSVLGEGTMFKLTFKNHFFPD